MDDRCGGCRQWKGKVWGSEEMIGMDDRGRNELTTKGEPVTGVVFVTALDQRRRNEIWCNVIWWRRMLEMLASIETDRIWISITLINARDGQTQGMQARSPPPPPFCQGAFASVRLDWKIRLPLRGRANGGGGGGFGGVGKTRGECRASSDVYPTWRNIQSPCWYSFKQHTYISSSNHRFMITHIYTQTQTHTHTHTHTVILVRTQHWLSFIVSSQTKNSTHTHTHVTSLMLHCTWNMCISIMD